MEDKSKLIDSIIKALGTMVVFPLEESDPNMIGKKNIVGNVQRPILEGVNRDKVLTKLVEIITS